VVAPVGFEFRGAADALEPCALLEQVSQPGDEHGDWREPVMLGRGVVGLKRRPFEAHRHEFKPAASPAGLRCVFQHVFCGKWLSVFDRIFRRPPILHARLPAKGGV
jgi:hypothetical protein